MDIIEITWVDSNVITGWNSVEWLKKTLEEGLPKAFSVGYLFFENDEQVVLTQSLTEHNGISEVQQIPKSSIITRKVVSSNVEASGPRENADEKG